MNKHELAKSKICRWCCSKVGKIQLRNNSLKESKLGTFYNQFFEPIDNSDENRPHIVCNCCKLYLFKRSSGGDIRKMPLRFDWPTIRNTRLNKCNEMNLCPMCAESSRFGRLNQAPIAIIHKKPGRPRVTSPQKILKLCNKCMTQISPGISHICLKSTLISNTQSILEHHQALDTFVGDNISPRTSQCIDIPNIQLPKSSGGNPLYVAVASSRNDEPPKKVPKMDFSHVAHIKSSGAMSNRQLKAVTKVIRDVGIPCPSMESYYKERHLLCDEILECLQVELDYSKEKYTSEYIKGWVVRCCNIDALIEKLYNVSGEVSVRDLHFKLGLDYGRGFTKLLLSLQDNNSVNDLAYLWVMSAPENHYNFSIMFQDSQITHLIEEYNVSFTVDLKAGATCLGIMLGRHPCLWCNWDKRTGLQNVECHPRSSAHHHEMFDKLHSKYNGDSKTHAIDCDGIEDPEAVNIWLSDYMQMFNLPELHLLLGVGQKLYDGILKTMSDEEKELHDALLKKHNIKRSAYHGGVFEGNPMRK